MQSHYSAPRLPCKRSRTDLCHGGSRPSNTALTSFPSTTSRVVPRQKGIVGTLLIPNCICESVRLSLKGWSRPVFFHMSGSSLPEWSSDLQTALFSLEEEPRRLRASALTKTFSFVLCFVFVSPSDRRVAVQLRGGQRRQRTAPTAPSVLHKSVVKHNGTAERGAS